MSGLHVAAALVTIAQKWTAFPRDPAWCMRYVELASDFLTTHSTFLAPDILVHAINSGLLRNDKLPVDVWADGHQILISLGWVAPLPFAADGSRKWMSLL